MARRRGGGRSHRLAEGITSVDLTRARMRSSAPPPPRPPHAGAAAPTWPAYGTDADRRSSRATATKSGALSCVSAVRATVTAGCAGSRWGPRSRSVRLAPPLWPVRALTPLAAPPDAPTGRPPSAQIRSSRVTIVGTDPGDPDVARLSEYRCCLLGLRHFWDGSRFRFV